MLLQAGFLKAYLTLNLTHQALMLIIPRIWLEEFVLPRLTASAPTADSAFVPALLSFSP
jgi:hypothetical protein